MENTALQTELTKLKQVVGQYQGMVENFMSEKQQEIANMRKYYVTQLSQTVSTLEEDQNGICSVLLMDFLIELSYTLHNKLKPV